MDKNKQMDLFVRGGYVLRETAGESPGRRMTLVGNVLVRGGYVLRETAGESPGRRMTLVGNVLVRGGYVLRETAGESPGRRMTLVGLPGNDDLGRSWEYVSGGRQPLFMSGV